jgi:CheY-like chemotaxis protein
MPCRESGQGERSMEFFLPEESIIIRSMASVHKDQSLAGLKILVVEDELLAALDLAHMMQDLGATVIGPAGTLREAEQLARDTTLHGAILDVKLRGNTSLALAEQLLDSGIPVILATGYTGSMLPERFAHTPKLSKPYSPAAVGKITAEHFRPMNR